LAQRLEEKSIVDHFQQEFNRTLEHSHIRYYRTQHEEDIKTLRMQLLKKLESEFDEADVLFRIRKLSELAKKLEEKMDKADSNILDTKEYRQLADSYRKTLQQIEAETAKLSAGLKLQDGPDLTNMNDEQFNELKKRQNERDKFLSVRKLMGE
jgi:hypothetical protein